MGTLQWLSQSALAGALGWTLLHSLWQGAVIAIALAMSRDATRRASANARYVFACAAMVACVVWAGATFARLYEPARQAAHTSGDAMPAPLVVNSGHEESFRPAGEAQSRRVQTIGPLLDAVSGWVAVVWAIGAGLMALRQLGGWMLVRRLRKSASPIEDARLLKAFEEVSRRVGARSVVRLAESSMTQVPAVIGMIEPMVLLPMGAVTGLTIEQLRGLLAHELAHVRRLDYAANLVQSAIETLLFYSPAAWWIGRIIRQERENCCDDIAAAVCDRAVYARALVSMERLRQIPAPALSARGGSLLSRISRLLQPAPQSPAGGRSWITAAALLLVVAAVVAMPSHRARAQDAETNSTNPSPDGKGVYYISGVPRSGAYALAGTARHVRQAMLAAGFHDDPSGKVIVVIRRDPSGQELRQTFALDKVYADANGGIALQDNDVLLVQEKQPMAAVILLGNGATVPAKENQRPPSGQYYMGGDVPRAGVYSLTGREVSVLEALIAAGADPTQIKSDQLEVIRRTAGKGETKYTFDVARVLEGIDPPFILQANDIVYVHAEAADKAARFVRLVVGKDQMTFEGEPVTYDKLADAVAKTPDLSDTVFQVAVDSGDVTVGRLNEAVGAASTIVQQLGMKYVTEIGVHPLGTKGGDETTGAHAAP